MWFIFPKTNGIVTVISFIRTVYARIPFRYQIIFSRIWCLHRTQYNFPLMQIPPEPLGSGFFYLQFRFQVQY